MMKAILITALVCATASSTLHAKRIGEMVPAQALTRERISELEQPAEWTRYLDRSNRLMELDRETIAIERAELQGPPPASPPAGSLRSMPLDKAREWYGSDEARAIADNIVSFQTPAGGWGKNQNRAAAPRMPGQSFVIGTEQLRVGPGGRKVPTWSYVGTIDNGATHTEMRFLAKVQSALPGTQGDTYRSAILRGLQYLLDAQFPNGGWPQVYPLQGGYHDAITFNDGGIAQVAMLMADMASREGPFGFLSEDVADQARKSASAATNLILSTQVTIDGRRTIWGQQYDPITLAVVGARNFEPAALATDESVDIIRFLSDARGKDSAAVCDAIHWLRRHELEGALWARFYDLRSQTPIFGDRDKGIYDQVGDISEERRTGYSWFNQRPERVKGLCTSA